MAYPEYHKGQVDCTVEFDTSNVNRKTVIVTGGAKGMGEEAVRAFAKAGAHVTFGDMDAKAGEALQAELGSKTQFVQCDVREWDDQLKLFKSAIATSPKESIEIVIANAGISGPDVLFAIEESDEPVKPELNILNVNMIGVMYSMKLARHYFMKQPKASKLDRCFIINASLVGFLDVPGIPQYMASKWGCRALMRCLRRTTLVDGIRACITAPWYVGTTILSPQVQEYVLGKGIVFAKAEDAAVAMMRIASDTSINGRSFAIVPRDIAPKGFMDLGLDDYADKNLLDDLQNTLLKTSHRLQVKAEDQ